MIDPLLKLATGLAIAEPTPFGEALVLTGLVAYGAIRAARNFRELQSGEKSSLNRFNIVQFDGDVLQGPAEDSFAQDFGLLQEPAQIGNVQDAILSNPAELIQGLLKTRLPQEAVRDPSFSQDLPQLGPQDPVVRQEGGEVEKSLKTEVEEFQQSDKALEGRLSQSSATASFALKKAGLKRNEFVVETERNKVGEVTGVFINVKKILNIKEAKRISETGLNVERITFTNDEGKFIEHFSVTYDSNLPGQFTEREL